MFVVCSFWLILSSLKLTASSHLKIVQNMNFQVRTVSFREGVTTMIYPSVIFAVENTSVPFIIIFLLKDGGHKERKNTNMLAVT